MHKEKLISDNPFRLLSLASETPFPVLRRRADAATKGAAVGMSQPAALSGVFGDADFEQLQTNLRILATDAMRRTCYRIMWPYTTLSLDAVLFNGNLSRASSSAYVIDQAQFLEAWFEFLEAGDPSNLREALKYFRTLKCSKEGRSYLSTFLMEEQPMLESEANTIAEGAYSSISKHLLSRSAGVAAILGREGSSSKCCSIVMHILDSPLSFEYEDSCLGKVIEYGNMLSAQLATETSEMANVVNSQPKIISQLKPLTEAIGHRHPITNSWREGIEACHSKMVDLWIDQAVDLSNKYDKYETAVKILEKCKEYKVSRIVSTRLYKNIKTIRENLANQAASVGKSSSHSVGAIAKNTNTGLPIGCIFWGMLIGVGGISSLFPKSDATNGSGVNSPSHYDSSSSAVGATSTNVESTGVEKSVKPTPVDTDSLVIDAERVRLRSQYDELTKEVNSERSRLSDEQTHVHQVKSELDIEMSALDAASQKLDQVNSSIELQRSFASADGEQLAQFNESVNSYNKNLRVHRLALASYNDRVANYNFELTNLRKHLHDFNKKVNQTNQLAGQINRAN